MTWFDTARSISEGGDALTKITSGDEQPFSCLFRSTEEQQNVQLTQE